MENNEIALRMRAYVPTGASTPSRDTSIDWSIYWRRLPDWLRRRQSTCVGELSLTVVAQEDDKLKVENYVWCRAKLAAIFWLSSTLYSIGVYTVAVIRLSRHVVHAATCLPKAWGRFPSGVA
jgi:hypothetical protein